MTSKSFSNNLTGVLIGRLVGAWLVISTVQTMHFYFYFEQSFWNSVRWSFRDWLVWFGLFAVIYHLVGKRLDLQKPSLWLLVLIALVGVVSGFLQVLIIISLDFIQGTASRPFWQDFWHFYNKRWFQYLLVFGLFWLLMSRHILRQHKNQNAKERNAEVVAKVKIDDGKNSYWLTISNIEWVVAAGNYVCIHHGSDQLVVRSTIKDMHATLGDKDFLRISRSILVNIGAITASQRSARNRLELVLASGAKVKVGPSYKEFVSEYLKLE